MAMAMAGVIAIERQRCDDACFFSVPMWLSACVYVCGPRHMATKRLTS